MQETQDPRKIAYAQIEAKLHEIAVLYAEAEKIADEAGVSFSTSGPSYGMGGYYQPKANPATGWSASDDDETGWVSSSNNC